MRRTERSDRVKDPAGALHAMQICRTVMVDICRTVRPMGPFYHGASMVISAIDAFATLLTGERYYFSASGSSPASADGQTSPPGPAGPDSSGGRHSPDE
jgi:hypothetical protein